MRIIVAVDGSSCSKRAVELVGKFSWKADDEFTILNVVEPVPVDCSLGVLLDERVPSQDYVDSTELVTKMGLMLKDQIPEHKIEARVLTGLVVDEICHWASTWNADLIVIGSHGRKGLQHFMLGSVAEEVLKKAPCSVEIVKEKKKLETSETSKEEKHKKEPKVMQPETKTETDFMSEGCHRC